MTVAGTVVKTLAGSIVQATLETHSPHRPSGLHVGLPRLTKLAVSPPGGSPSRPQVGASAEMPQVLCEAPGP